MVKSLEKKKMNNKKLVTMMIITKKAKKKMLKMFLIVIKTVIWGVEMIKHQITMAMIQMEMIPE